MFFTVLSTWSGFQALKVSAAKFQVYALEYGTPTAMVFFWGSLIFWLLSLAGFVTTAIYIVDTIIS